MSELFERLHCCLHLNCFPIYYLQSYFFHVHLVVIQYSVFACGSIHNLLLQQRRCNLIKHTLYTGFITDNSLFHVTGQPYPTRQTIPRVWYKVRNRSQSIPWGIVWLQFTYAKPHPGCSLATIYFCKGTCWVQFGYDFVRETIPWDMLGGGYYLPGTPYRLILYLIPKQPFPVEF